MSGLAQERTFNLRMELPQRIVGPLWPAAGSVDGNSSDVEVGLVIYECRHRKPDEWTLDAKRLVSFLTRPWDDGSY